jgi:hypothetical protein
MPWRRRGSGGNSSTILGLGIRSSFVMSFTPRSLCPGERGLDTSWNAGCTPEPGRTLWRRKEFLFPAGNRLGGRPVHSQITLDREIWGAFTRFVSFRVNASRMLIWLNTMKQLEQITSRLTSWTWVLGSESSSRLHRGRVVGTSTSYSGRPAFSNINGRDWGF